MKARTGECVYCAQVGPITDDHVPPKALWGKPRPDDLVVVPSCEGCNSGASKDDEYFKTMIVLKDKAGSHPEAVAIRDSVFRGLAMPRKAGFKNHILASMLRVPMHSPAGVYLGHAPAFDVSLKRLDLVVARITRGLYWHHNDSQRLPTAAHVVVWSEAGLADIDSEAAANLRTHLVEPCLAQPERTLGRGVLRYWYSPSDRPQMTGWVYEFFGDVRFVAFTLPEGARREV